MKLFLLVCGLACVCAAAPITSAECAVDGSIVQSGLTECLYILNAPSQTLYAQARADGGFGSGSVYAAASVSDATPPAPQFPNVTATASIEESGMFTFAGSGAATLQIMVRTTRSARYLRAKGTLGVDQASYEFFGPSPDEYAEYTFDYRIQLGMPFDMKLTANANAVGPTFDHMDMGMGYSFSAVRLFDEQGKRLESTAIGSSDYVLATQYLPNDGDTGPVIPRDPVETPEPSTGFASLLLSVAGCKRAWSSAASDTKSET